MSNSEQIPANTAEESDEITAPQAVDEDDDLDDLDDMEFMLDEIENRIAPLA
jgi:hypothetical protein